MSLFATPFVGESVDTVLHVVAFVMMAGGIFGSLFLFWRLHEMPVHKAKEKNKYKQIELVTVLTWIGFVAHWVWVIAVFIAFIDFDKLIASVKQIWLDVENIKPSEKEDVKENLKEDVKEENTQVGGKTCSKD